MTDGITNIFALDAAYKPFPRFSKWAANTTLDLARWDRYTAAIAESAESNPDALKRSLQIAKRAAALDTGALEGLYEVDRGFTYSVAFETSAWEVKLAERGEQVRPLFEAQLHAYNYVLDLATKAEPISEAAIRTLHEVVCAAQATYRVETSFGPQDQALPKGQYKVLPNHVRTRRGENHSYAPVDVTPEEMFRLVAELRSAEFLSAHPAIQAAYAHYCLVVIHPFADGNGRVARALASTFTYRAISMPIMILSEQKGSYLDALENADTGNYQAFVDFMLARCFDTIDIVRESMRSANVPSTEESLDSIRRLFSTKTGYTHENVETAGKNIFEALFEELKRQTASLGGNGVQPQLAVSPPANRTSDPTHREALSGQQAQAISLSFYAPALPNVYVSRSFRIWLPTNAASNEDVQVRLEDGSDIFSARMDESFPVPSEALRIKISVFIGRVIGAMLAQLKDLAEQALRPKK